MREKPLTEFIGSKKAAKEHKEKPAEPKVVGLKGPWELPEGWRWVRLGDVVQELKPGFARNKKHISDDGIPHLRPNNIGLGRLNLESIVKVKIEYGFNPRDYYLKKGDILFNNTNSIELVGRAALVSKNLEFGYSNHITRIRVKENLILPEWLVFVINYLWMQGYFRRVCTHWIGQAGVNMNTLKKTPIPLPPLSEQKRIVAKLNEVSKRLEEAKHLAREAREEAERLMASALHEVFSKAEEKGWEWVRLGKIAELKAGGTPSRRVREYWKNGTIPWVKISDIPDSGLVEKTEEKITELGLKNSSAKLLPPGTILFSIFATISKVGILKISATTNQAIVGIIPKITIDQKYLFYSLKYFGQELVALGRGGVQDNINKRMLAKLKTPLPPLEEQQRIVAYLDSINEHAQKLVSLYEEQEKELEQLFPAVLDRAFRGEL